MNSIDSELLEKRKLQLTKAVAYHGHLCMGQVLGVHLTENGLAAIGNTDLKNLIVYVENDRCIADTIQILTGTRLGRRNMKLINYGKMAATFVNLESGRAFRVWISGNISACVGSRASTKLEKDEQCQLLLAAPSDQIVSLQEVNVVIPKEEMPGKPLRVVVCVRCNERVMDGKDLQGTDGPLCRACAGIPYYQTI